MPHRLKPPAAGLAGAPAVVVDDPAAGLCAPTARKGQGSHRAGPVGPHRKAGHAPHAQRVRARQARPAALAGPRASRPLARPGWCLAPPLAGRPPAGLYAHARPAGEPRIYPLTCGAATRGATRASALGSRGGTGQSAAGARAALPDPPAERASREAPGRPPPQTLNCAVLGRGCRDGQRRATGAGGQAMSEPLDPYVAATIFAAVAPFFAYTTWRYRPQGDEIPTLHLVMFTVSFAMLFLVLFLVAKVLVRGTLN